MEESEASQICFVANLMPKSKQLLDVHERLYVGKIQNIIVKIGSANPMKYLDKILVLPSAI